ncbi:hypothetical protein [Estrella lausannensis]|uniref:Uncharacterized protein n=1 Tax=Estrella lausannensis TaxID=483423 RepID=A0A0H5DN53_9BACT|nr:hypothetical protein [Estrella lausannensis]CRX37676.1 Hypothetical protein ELAC_0315 [Estrella lausannensis]
MVAFHGVATLDELDSMLQSYKNKGRETSETESILLVNDQCRVVTRFFSGKSYLAGAFATKVPTTIEKIVRVVLGLLATLISCGWALCFQGVRDLFGAHVQKICFAVFQKDSGPDKTLCGVEKSIITAFKVERTCKRGRCDIGCCHLEHEDLHS